MKNQINNKFTVYGLNSSIAVLNSNNCLVEYIYIAKDTLAFKDERLKKIINKNEYTNKVNLTDLNKIKTHKNTNRTQGVLVCFRFNGIKESVYDFLPNQNTSKDNCILILDQLEDPQNLGQIVRTCECAGVDKILLTRNKSVKLSDTCLQVSQGAFVNIAFYICTNLRDSLSILKKNNFWIVALENKLEGAQSWDTVNLKGNIGIIIGSEGRGIRKLTLKNSDYIATIPMQGEINSLNASAASSAILFERLRQILN
ncbi:MAG: hypothetical protein CMG00_03150 [Candidatus Marinimicrobia bacterium]|nr:hypothetical protein [Candidatus Neomarinimicrobiota bacterium]|tara:strand:+ start:58 stop:825 length:768 start_codon:yes stop_codon:yes gene_type:complete